jgi:hypothetical protein
MVDLEVNLGDFQTSLGFAQLERDSLPLNKTFLTTYTLIRWGTINSVQVEIHRNANHETEVRLP